ncbi:NAD-dependent deacetylase [Sulfurimonas sp. SAG-AH-194-C20]|nr:Sir2 family NAD-dependent protein deacetylase [Sulfurimonas sp. SAG-AH-194-C20]MDF1878421.1 NAD-dependent deacetylase [Sulfurimonas sp. SAG-AH-194-C20]
MTEQYLQEIRDYIKDADAVLITAGAGVGVDSGLPDFRGDEGFWKAYPVIKDLGISFSEMANPQWFQSKPTLAWAFYGHRLNLYRETIPHEGFKMLLNLVKEKNEDYFIYTSNVDGQFQKAQFDEEKIVEVHGSILHNQCSVNCSREIYDAPQEHIEIDMQKFEATTLPQCKNCNGIARPNIMMFGDWDWREKRTYQQKVRFKKWLRNVELENKKLVIIEIGAGTAIPTIRQKGEMMVENYNNTKLIRINPREFDIGKNLGWSVTEGGLAGLSKILLNDGEHNA